MEWLKLLLPLLPWVYTVSKDLYHFQKKRKKAKQKRRPAQGKRRK